MPTSGRASTRAPGRVAGVWSMARWLFLLALLTRALLFESPDRREPDAEQAAQPLTFNLVDWELSSLAQRFGSIVAVLRGLEPPASSIDASALRAHFQVPAGNRSPARGELERTIERLISQIWRDEGLQVASPLADGQLIVFPPVSFTLTAPPQLLVVSPRDRIEVSQSVLLRPRLETAEIDQLESGVALKGVATLVTPIGGLATYPAMVLESSAAESVLSAVAHEWVHAYFFFQPLGREYWSNPGARIVNETAAELVGREVGARLARQLDLPTSARDASPSPRQIEFNTLLGATRRETDRLLAAGEVEAAERHMELRRQELNARGFPIRRLNQAYFAFHGSYAEGPAGSSPLAAEVRRVRQASPSLGAFVREIAQWRPTSTGA